MIALLVRVLHRRAHLPEQLQRARSGRLRLIAVLVIGTPRTYSIAK